MTKKDRKELEAVKKVCDTFVGFYFTKDEDGKKIRIDRQFKDIIAFGKHLVHQEQMGYDTFHNMKISILLKWMRKSSRNIAKPKTLVLDQINLSGGVDKIIVNGKKQQIKYSEE